MKPARLFGAAVIAALSVCGFATPAPVPAAKDDSDSELAKLAGTWKVVSWKRAGVEQVTEDTPDQLIEFKKDGKFEWIENASGKGKIARIDPTKKPKEIDYTFAGGDLDGKTQKALYKLDGDTFSDCFGEPGTDRPTEFKSTKENGYSIVVYKRVKRKD